jgi:hypothetical protein
LLGVHPGPSGAYARAVLPGAERVEAFALDGTSLGVLERVDPRGLFEGPVAGERQPVRYRCHAGHYAWDVTDPYSFGPVLGPIDDFLIGEGTHHRLFDKLGAHVIDHEGARGVHFAVWAPNARLVSVVGDFNDWDGTRHPMRRRTDTGIWELFLPDIAGGRPTSTASSVPMARCSPTRPIPLPLLPNCARTPPRSRSTPRRTNGATRRTARSGPRPTRAACRSRSMKCIPDRGASRAMGGSSIAGTSWPTA